MKKSKSRNNTAFKPAILTKQRSFKEINSEYLVKESELRELSSAFVADNQKLVAIRSQLAKLLGELLVYYPEESKSLDYTQVLWKKCFYRPYDFYKTKLATAKKSENVAEIKVVLADVRHFFDNAQQFYINVCKKIEFQMKKANDTKSQLYRSSLHFCNIFLGDITRYREIHSDNTKKKWESSENFYRKALEILPESGNPHNQLAMLAMYQGNEFLAIYRYIRAYNSTIPFEIAKDNIKMVFKRVKPRSIEKLLEVDSNAPLKGIARAKVRKIYLSEVVFTHGVLFNPELATDKFFNSFNDRINYLNNTAKQLFKSDSLSVHMQYELITLCVYSLINTKSRLEKDDESLNVRLHQCAKLLFISLLSSLSKSTSVPEYTTQTGIKFPTSGIVTLTLGLDWIKHSSPKFFEDEFPGSKICYEQFWRTFCDITGKVHKFAMEEESLLGMLHHQFPETKTSRPALPEEIYMVNYTPFTDIYKSRCIMNMSKPTKESKASFVVRCYKIRAFALWVADTLDPSPFLYNSETKTKPSLLIGRKQKPKPNGLDTIKNIVPELDTVEKTVVLAKPKVKPTTKAKSTKAHIHDVFANANAITKKKVEQRKLVESMTEPEVAQKLTSLTAIEGKAVDGGQNVVNSTKNGVASEQQTTSDSDSTIEEYLFEGTKQANQSTISSIVDRFPKNSWEIIENNDDESSDEDEEVIVFQPEQTQSMSKVQRNHQPDVSAMPNSDHLFSFIDEEPEPTKQQSASHSKFMAPVWEKMRTNTEAQRDTRLKSPADLFAATTPTHHQSSSTWQTSNPFSFGMNVPLAAETVDYAFKPPHLNAKPIVNMAAFPPPPNSSTTGNSSLWRDNNTPPPGFD